MHIQEATNKDRWDAFVVKHPAANYQHLFGWKTSLEKTYGLKTAYLELIDNDKIVGVFPLAISGATWLAPMAVSLSLCNYAGPLALSSEIETILLEQAAIFLRQRYPRIKGIEMRRAVPGAICEKGFVTMTLDLPESPEALWLFFSNKIRNQIRKAQKSNLMIKHEKKYFPEFYRLYARNLYSHSTPVHSAKFLQNIMNEMDQYSELFTVWQDETLLAGMLFFKLDKTIGNCVTCSLRQYNDLRPGYLLYWDVLAWGAEHNFRNFDFGRSTVGTSTYDFKKHWGSRPIPIKYAYIMFNGHAPCSENKYDGKMARWFSRCWKVIPYSLSLWLGPKIRKRIA